MPTKAEHVFMLPGFRFLIAAVMLCLSLLVFGLGATALLRSAREDVASLPVRRAPQVTFAAQQPSDAPATLSMLRVETPEILPAAPADLPAAVPDTPAPSPPEPQQQATLSLIGPVVEAPEPEPSVQAVASPAVIENVAAVETIAAPVTPPAPPPVEVRAEAPAVVAAIAPPALGQPASTLTDADTQIAIMNIATLGGPAVDIEPVPLPKAKPAKREKTAEPTPKKKKKASAEEKPSKRRRLAARAEAPAPAAAPTPPETFGWQVPQR